MVRTFVGLPRTSGHDVGCAKCALCPIRTPTRSLRHVTDRLRCRVSEASGIIMKHITTQSLTKTGQKVYFCLP